MSETTTPTPAVATYDPVARALHWLTVLFIAFMIPVAKIMTARGEAGVWDATTNALYSAHKLAGFVLLWLVVLRLGYRLIRGAPPEPEGMPSWQRIASQVTHWAMYALLIAIALAGWVGTSMFPALNVFGAFDLPAIVGPDRETSETVFEIHELLVNLLLVVVAVHVAAALMHLIVWRDGVFGRMWPRRGD